MAFFARPDGLIDVDTPMGPLPMAPDVAMQLGWSPGTAEAEVQGPAPMTQDPGATAQYGSAGTPIPVPANPPPPSAPVDTGEWTGSVGSPTANQGAPLQPRTMGPAPAAAPEAPSGPGPMETLALSLPRGSENSASSRSGPAPITGPERQKIEGAQGAQREALVKSTQAEGAIADYMTEQANAEAAKLRQIQQNDALRQQRMNERLAEMQTKREELRRAVPDEIDPARWNKMGGGGAVLAAVSIALGGIAQGLTGRDNPGMATINDLIARDIAAQKDEIALAQDSADQADNELQRYTDLYGDPILAEKQLELNDLEAMKKETQARIQGSQADVIKAGGAQLVAELDEQQALKRNEMDGRAQQIMTQSQFQGESPTETQKRVMAGRAEDQAVDDPLAGLKESDKNAIRQVQVIMPDGSIKYAKDKEAATKASEVFTAYKRGYQLLGELEKIARTPGKSISAEMRTRAEQMEGELTKVVGSLLAPGEALSDSERKFFSSIALSAAGGFDVFGTVEPMIKQARDMFLQRANLATEGQLYNDPFRTEVAGSFVAADPRVRKTGL